MSNLQNTPANVAGLAKLRASRLLAPRLACDGSRNESPRLRGRCVLSGERFQVPGLIGPEDLLEADFDVLGLAGNGLYLLELHTADGVQWRGARELRGAPGGAVQAFEGGGWSDLPIGGDLRIVAKLLRVFRAEALPLTARRAAALMVGGLAA